MCSFASKHADRKPLAAAAHLHPHEGPPVDAAGDGGGQEAPEPTVLLHRSGDAKDLTRWLPLLESRAASPQPAASPATSPRPSLPEGHGQGGVEAGRSVPLPPPQAARITDSEDGEYL